jgi:hypothetical protein
MTSKMLYVAGMNTESDFPDIYLDFIRQHGIPSALRRDNAKSKMSQTVCQIHRDLVIADQWTEPHSGPWQNPAEINGVKYLKSHAQVLLDRTGAPDSMWLLAQDYLAHIHNLSANCFALFGFSHQCLHIRFLKFLFNIWFFIMGFILLP